jgi:phage terminase large subunit
MSTAVKRISTGYVARPLQRELHMKCRRFSVLVMHRRFGKTVWAINHTIDKGLRNARHNPQYAYLAPFRDQAKRIAWEYLKQYTQNIPGVEVNEAELRVDIPRPDKDDRVRIMLMGADNYDAIRGMYLDGVILDEFAQINPIAWREVLRPALSDRLGWAIFLGTPKGRNEFCDMYERAVKLMAADDKEWFAALYRASETGIIPKEELESLKKDMSEDEYEQEYECSFQAGVAGAYFSKEMASAEKEGRICAVPYDPALSVLTYWDLGLDDVTGIWFMQRHFAQWRAIKYIQAPDTSLTEWIKIVRDTRYVLGQMHFPHDIQVRDLITGKSRYDTAVQLVGRSMVRVIPKIESKLDSIEAARRMIPRTVFDEKNCERGIKALKQYQRKWDPKNQSYSPKPMHNWASNASDAFQGFAMGALDDRGDEYRKFQETADTDYDVFARR